MLSKLNALRQTRTITTARQEPPCLCAVLSSFLKVSVCAVHPVQIENDLADSTQRRIMGLMYYR